MQHYNQKHYNYFRQYLSFNQGLVGNNIKDWWDFVTKNPTRLPSVRLTRQQLKELCHQNSGYSDEECLGAVMAWGGQNRIHGRILFSRKADILPIIEEIRKGHCCHIEAYNKFDKIWKTNGPLGMGAAYFTKLIFFCEPSHTGFIMDQWTSKSTNLLCSKEIIHLQNNYVSKRNNSQTYINFCAIVQDMAKKLGVPAEYIEVAMFSKGGRNKLRWREYVVQESRSNK